MATKDIKKKRATSNRYYARNRDKILAKQVENKEKIQVRKAAYRLAHLEEFRAKGRQDYVENRENILERARKARQDNPEKTKEYNKKTYAKKREKSLKENKEWRKKNPEKYKAYHAEYRKNHREHARELTSQWIKDHPEEHRVHGLRRLARRKGLPDAFTSTDRQFMTQYWGYACAACGNQEGFEWYLADDHWIPLSASDCLGTVPENIIPLCHGKGGCNNTKQARNAKEWLIERFGTYKAKKILKDVETYFSIVKERKLHC